MIKKKYEFIIQRKMRGIYKFLYYFPFTTVFMIRRRFVYDNMTIITGETMDEIEKKKDEIWDIIIEENAEKLKGIPTDDLEFLLGDRTWHLEG